MIDAIGGALPRPGTYTGQVRELLTMATCAARYPLGVLEGPLPALGDVDDTVHDTPVVLIHGYGHNRSGWHMLERHLRGAGFSRVAAFNYNSFWPSVPEVAERLAHRIEVIRAVTGSDKVHVVGHSLGGIILRWYVQEEGGDQAVHTAVTVAAPHEGAVVARLCIGETAKQLRPGSWVMRRLERSARPSDVRWVAFYSNLDVLVPGTSAMLRHPALAATNLLAKDHGHLSAMLSPRVAAAITRQLEAAEGVEGLATVSALPPADTAAGPEATALAPKRPGTVCFG